MTLNLVQHRSEPSVWDRADDRLRHGTRTLARRQ